ncbi:MAG: transcription elongation factor GreA [Christensenellales bacterium]
MADIFLTKEGREEKEKYLDYLKSERRQEVVEKLKAAREFGDLSENSEYDAARDEQRKLEAEIEKIEETLRQAKIVDVKDVKSDKVGVGTTVKLYDMEFDEEVEYSIVGSLESNPSKGLISNESPIGKSLMGKKVGDVVNVEAPAGSIKMKVLKISV